jgi:hypothetical protein
MNYRNTEMKIDQILSYFNEEKINLSPAFQRGHVWQIGTRRALLANIVQGKPIPAIFLYKEASGTRYSYNILDGKQRLESLILFVANERDDLKVANWSKYFFEKEIRSKAGFWVKLPDGKQVSFKQLGEDVIRDFREYAIPTVEISLSEETHLDEIIDLFVDINQKGVQVSRFDIVKAMGQGDKLLTGTFKLVAAKQRRGQDIFYKPIKNDFTRVLKALTIIAKVSDGKSRVDRTWERLLEIALFSKTRRHRKPVDILKSFISKSEKNSPLTADEIKNLKKPFKFLAGIYANSGLEKTPLATEQTHFYTMITSLIATDLLTRYEPQELTRKLVALGTKLANKNPPKELKKYIELSSDRTTDTPRREERQKKFVELLGSS